MNIFRSQTSSRLLLVVVLFLLGVVCTACGQTCDREELVSYVDKINAIHDSFVDFTNQSANHPEYKADNVAQMKAVQAEFEALEPPRCAKNLYELSLEAMTTHITFLAPTQDVFYFPFQLYKFTLDDWQAVDDEANRLLDKYSY